MHSSSSPSGDIRKRQSDGRGPVRAVGDVLVCSAGADRRTLRPEDRARFVTAGGLMVLTGILAAYAGSTVVALGFGISTTAALPFGLVYALFIYCIDRSVLLTPRTYRLRRDGKVEPAGPGISTVVRVLIAVCAALIVGETLLLRFFESSIAARVTEIRQEETGRALAEWDANQSTQLTSLTDDLASKQARLDAASALVGTKTEEVNCQLTGGPSCLGGAGPVYQLKLAELAEATAAVTESARLRNEAQDRLDAFRESRDTRREQFAAELAATTGVADDLLIREQAFWRLTMDDRSVLVWRIVLTMLLLGIDLAPLSFKRALDRTAPRRRERLDLWREESTEELDADQIGHTARERRKLAPTVAERLVGRYEDYVLRRDGVEATIRWSADRAGAFVAEEEILMDRDARLRELRRRHGSPAPRRPPEPPETTGVRSFDG